MHFRKKPKALCPDNSFTSFPFLQYNPGGFFPFIYAGLPAKEISITMCQCFLLVIVGGNLSLTMPVEIYVWLKTRNPKTSFKCLYWYPTNCCKPTEMEKVKFRPMQSLQSKRDNLLHPEQLSGVPAKWKVFVAPQQCGQLYYQANGHQQ